MGPREMATPNIGTKEFSDIVQQHRPLIFQFLLASSRDMDMAETLTQECFLKAYRNWLGFRGESNPKTWLIRIAINLQKDQWRSRRTQFWRQTQVNALDLDSASDWLASAESSPEEQVLARQQVAQVWKVVENLNRRQRTVFLLHFQEDLELSEIASSTGLKVGAVKEHLSRAVAKVRASLEGSAQDRR